MALVAMLPLAACTRIPAGIASSATPGLSTSTLASPGATTPAIPTTPGTPGSHAPASAHAATEPQTLPRGGLKIFPSYRLVGYSGHPDAPALGRLGIGNLDERVQEMEEQAQPFADGRKIMPVLELIAVVVQAGPGPDGMFRSRTQDSTIQTYLDAARRQQALLLLNIQPGRSTMTTEVKALSKWLKEPDVGLALDPEWDVGPGQVPGTSYGHTDGSEINEIATYLDEMAINYRLPQKALVFHQVAHGVVTDESAIKDHDGVAVIKSVDGIGGMEAKTQTYDVLMKNLPSTIHPGFKLFFEEDEVFGPLMTPQQVLALRPKPEYILYE